MVWWTAVALAASEPCYGHSQAERAESDHFWLEWPDGAVRQDQAAVVLDAMETAREKWLELGYGFTDGAIVAEIVPLGEQGISGLTTTKPCGDALEPFIQLYFGQWDSEDMIDVATHETAHAAQYADMGSYTDGVASWAWWMEGHATWLTPQADKQWDGWARTVGAYMERVQLPLVHGVEGYLDAEASRHMYGTTWVVHALAELVGDDAVRETWVWGGERAGERLSFIEAVDAVSPAGFTAFWGEYLARLPTTQIESRREVDRPPRTRVEALPASGGEVGAGGLGVSIVQLPDRLADPDASVQFTFDGGGAPWLVVLVATARSGALVEYVVLDAADGQAEGWISRFDVDLWLVASPLNDVVGLQPFTWTAALGEASAPMEGAVVLDPERSGDAAEGCGCDHGGAAVSAWALLAALGLLRRR
jgi:uncharacterized protein (TIGR03382 family)